MRRPPRTDWRLLLAALAFGLVEWLALVRSRAGDRLGAITRR